MAFGRGDLRETDQELVWIGGMSYTLDWPSALEKCGCGSVT
ncbi:MAG: hypothetical protein ACI9MB_004797, partial [Verrucomicrobiales bacterium]